MRKLLAVLLLSASAFAATHTVTIAWTAPASGAATYNVYRGTATGAEVLYASGVTTLSYLDSTVTNGVTYFYYVTAVSPGGESVPSAEASVQIPTPPGPPTGLSVTVH
jgi:fibronectin type 3 domain-containing protein